MGHPRRGYVLIGVLVALALCVTVVGAYAAASRRAVTQIGADIDRARASYAARGAAVQAMKDLATRLGVAPTGGSRGVFVGVTSDQGVVIPGLPAFPPEVAAAGGFLGEIARKMEEIRKRQREDQQRRGEQDRAAHGRDKGLTPEQLEERARAAQQEPPPMPLAYLGAARVGFDGLSAPVIFECETGKLNINLVPRNRLELLLAALGVPDDQATNMLNALEDYRIDRAPPGSADRRYTRDRDRFKPLKGRTLDRLEELLAVPGFTPDLYERLTPHATVLGGSVIDPNYATREVFQALGVREDAVLRALADAQRRLDRLERDRLREIVGDAAFRLMEDAVAYRLRPIFTVRATAVVNKAVGRHLLRMEFSETTGLPQLLESREGWM